MRGRVCLGMTLLELVCACAILGGVMVAGSGLYLRWLAKLRLEQSQVAVADLLNRARAETRRLAERRVVEWTEHPPSIVVKRPDGTVVERLDLVKTELRVRVGRNSLVFLPPHGRKDITNFEFELLGSYALNAKVRVIGVTGKVIRVAP